MTLLELEGFLNSKLAKFIGEKVKIDIGFYLEWYERVDDKLIRDLLKEHVGFDANFYDDLYVCISDALNEVGLNDMFRYKPGFIVFNHDYSNKLYFDLYKVFDINMKLNDDIVYQPYTNGIIVNINVKLREATPSNLTPLELFDYNCVESKKQLLDFYENDLKTKLSEIEELKEQITKLKTQLQTL